MPGSGSVADFVTRLAQVRMPNVFNPYAQTCSIYDLPNAPEIRRRNLELVLEAALKRGGGTLWIAQDLGRKGGRRTGLAMTDEPRLPVLASHWQVAGIQRATKGEEVAEATAAYVWQALDRTDKKVFLWNVFPLQPHPPGEPLRNRGHTRQEADRLAWTLDWVIERLGPRRVVALGRFAERELAARGIACACVRHPGRGGGPKFLREIKCERK